MRVTRFYDEKSPVVSMEFFPPRDEKAMVSFGKTIDALVANRPDYMTVTFGAGGSTRDGSYQTVKALTQEKQQPTVGYVAGFGLGPEEISQVLDSYQELGVETIFVVRGDQPRDDGFTPHPESLRYAAEMIALIKKRYNFTLGCAGYPEGHPEAPSREKDIEFLKAKVDNGAEYIVAQYFYDNAFFFDYVDKCRAAGINVPIIPGIMPVYTVKMTQMLARVCGATITDDLQAKLGAVNSEDKDAVLKLGIEKATEQCRGLLKAGVAGLHFYTMNRSRSTSEIIGNLKTENLL